MNIKKQVLLTLAIFGLSLGVIFMTAGCSAEKQELKNVEARVNAVLKGMTLVEGSDSVTQGDEQTAMCQWYRNRGMLQDPFEFGKASDEFDRWRAQAGSFYIRAYTIDSIKIVKGIEPVTGVVSGTIDGSPFSMRCPKGEPIVWIQAPVGSGDQ